MAPTRLLGRDYTSRDYGSDGLDHRQTIILLCSLAGAALLITLIGLVWCIVRRRKHRAPVLPYHLHTIAPPHGQNGAEAQPEGAPDAQGETPAGYKHRTKGKRPPPFGQEGRGLGFGFNPVFKEAYGGGGGAESGQGPITVQRVGPSWG